MTPAAVTRPLTWGSTYRTDDTIFSEESRRRSRFMAYLHRQGAGWRQRAERRFGQSNGGSSKSACVTCNLFQSCNLFRCNLFATSNLHTSLASFLYPSWARFTHRAVPAYLGRMGLLGGWRRTASNSFFTVLISELNSM